VPGTATLTSDSTFEARVLNAFQDLHASILTRGAPEEDEANSAVDDGAAALAAAFFGAEALAAGFLVIVRLGAMAVRDS